MLVQSLSSSSLSQWERCPHSFFINQVLKFPSPPNKKAEKGSIVHKAMECLAKKKLAIQNGQHAIEDRDVGTLLLGDCNPDLLTELAYNYISNRSQELEWVAADLRECKKWTQACLAYNNGQFDPMNWHIISPEHRFRIEMPSKWAKFKYTHPNGDVVEDTWKISGIVDLVQQLNEDTYEVVDYKTGQRKDWNSGQIKDYDKLYKDIQLRLYYYAVRKMYPNIPHVLVTIFFVNDGGPYTLTFDDSVIEETEKFLKERFIEIYSTHIPRLNEKWQCRWCPYYKQDETSNPNGLSVCYTIKNAIVQKGIAQVTQEFKK